MKKILLITLVISLIICGFAIFAKSQITNLMSDPSQYENAIVGLTHPDVFSNEADYLAQLSADLDKSDIIIKGIFTGNRVSLFQTTLSQIHIVEVIKGDTALLDKMIAVYETNYFVPYQYHVYYQNHDCTNITIESKSYFFFLKRNNSIIYRKWGLSEYAFNNAEIKHYIYPTELQENDIAVLSAIDIADKKIPFSSISQYAYVVSSTEAAKQVQIVHEYVMDYLIAN